MRVRSSSIQGCASLPSVVRPLWLGVGVNRAPQGAASGAVASRHQAEDDGCWKEFLEIREDPQAAPRRSRSKRLPWPGFGGGPRAGPFAREVAQSSTRFQIRHQLGRVATSLKGI